MCLSVISKSVLVVMKFRTVIFDNLLVIFSALVELSGVKITKTNLNDIFILFKKLKL